MCAERVRSAALVCRYCGREFADRDVLGTADDAVHFLSGKIIAIALAALAMWFVYDLIAAYDRTQQAPGIAASMP